MAAEAAGGVAEDWTGVVLCTGAGAGPAGICAATSDALVQRPVKINKNGNMAFMNISDACYDAGSLPGDAAILPHAREGDS